MTPAGPGAVLAHVRAVEVLVHGWDLARATGQPGAFPAEVAVAPDAPAADRLAGFLGRQV